MISGGGVRILPGKRRIIQRGLRGVRYPPGVRARLWPARSPARRLCDTTSSLLPGHFSHTLAGSIAEAEIELRFGVALFGGEGEMLHRGIIIADRIGGHAFERVLHASRFRLFRVFGFRFLVLRSAGGERERGQDDSERKVRWRIWTCDIGGGAEIN